MRKRATSPHCSLARKFAGRAPASCCSARSCTKILAPLAPRCVRDAPKAASRWATTPRCKPAPRPAGVAPNRVRGWPQWPNAKGCADRPANGLVASDLTPAVSVHDTRPIPVDVVKPKQQQQKRRGRNEDQVLSCGRRGHRGARRNKRFSTAPSWTRRRGKKMKPGFPSFTVPRSELRIDRSSARLLPLLAVMRTLTRDHIR